MFEGLPSQQLGLDTLTSLFQARGSCSVPQCYWICGLCCGLLYGHWVLFALPRDYLCSGLTLRCPEVQVFVRILCPCQSGQQVPGLWCLSPQPGQHLGTVADVIQPDSVLRSGCLPGLGFGSLTAWYRYLVGVGVDRGPQAASATSGPRDSPHRAQAGGQSSSRISFLRTVMCPL